MRNGVEDGPPAARRVSPAPRSTWSDPRNVVPLAFITVLIVAGGRRLLEHWQARRAIRLLEEPDVTPEAIRAAARFGRPGLTEFFRLLAEGTTPEVRQAAGQALGRLWKRNDLVSEEERQVATRGFDVRWSARGRYPRSLNRPIPIVVEYGLAFLDATGDGLRRDDLAWSARVKGTRRASLEADTPWSTGEGRLAFTIEPADFDGKGPHRLVLQARVRPHPEPVWEQALPHVPFTFEFDPRLEPTALLASADDDRARAFGQAVRLSPVTDDSGPPTWLPIADDLLIRNPPVLSVTTPLPCDLAHAAIVEIDGFAGSIPVGPVVVDGQPDEERPRTITLEALPVRGDRPALDRPGTYRIRVVLTPDVGLGWASPNVRSIWPRPIVSGWIDVGVIRR